MKLKNKLTPTEIEVIKHIAQSDAEIAFQFFCSMSTIQSHIQRIFFKLNVKNRTQAAVRAIQEGIVKADDVIVDVQVAE